MTQSSQIVSVSHYVPEGIMKNSDFESCMETSDQWIRERTGIEERRFVKEGVACSALAGEAAKGALSKAGKNSGDIDMIIAATLSPDLYFPGIGTQLQNMLGASNIPALDIRAQCSGFVYGISCADAFIRSNQASRILLVCSEVQSPVLEMSTRGRDMAVLFGDGAGALVIEAVDTEELPSTNNQVRGIIDSILGSDGSGAEVLCLKTPGTATSGFVTEDSIREGLHRPRMDGRQVFKNAVMRMEEAATEILRRNNVSASDISLLLPHQANLRINMAVAEKLGLKPEQCFNNIQKYGNTTSATIPICLSEAEQEGKLKQGDLILTLAFGAGFTWGANLIRW